MARLGQICVLNMGQSPDSASYNKTGDGLPFFQGNADFGPLHPAARIWCNKPTKIAHAGDILISVRAPIGALNIADRECCIGRGLAALTVDETLCNRGYLWYAIANKVDELNAKGTGSTFKAISKNVLGETEISLPSLDRQRCVSAMLDKLSDLISLRKQQLAKLDELIKARFIELFGDPMINSKGYVLKKYGDLFEMNAGGTPSKQKPEYWDNGTIPWIGSNMCQNTAIYKNDGNYITEEGLNHSSARMFPVDTVLIALVGATIGKTALLKFETTTNQNVLGIRGIREGGYTPEFIFYYTQGLYQKFLNVGDGGFAMASKGFVGELPAPVVDLDIQKQFTVFVKQTDKSKLTIQQSLDKLEVLKKSLLQQYFG